MTKTEKIKVHARKKSEIIGLDDSQVIRSRQEYGSNELPPEKQTPLYKRIWENLSDPIIKILLFALAANIIFTLKNINWAENCGILLAIIISTAVSTISEGESEKAFKKLRESGSDKKYAVIRNGNERIIGINQIVKGDYIVISPGDMIPCDGRIISGTLYIDQSALNGESAEVEKKPSDETELALSSENSLLRGCLVLSGNGIMLCDRVGSETLYGNIARELKEKRREGPLRHRLSMLSSTISHIGYACAALVALAYLFNVFIIDSAFDKSIIIARIGDLRFVAMSLIKALTIAVTVIVVAVPEGLPMMITVVLSSNMKKMMKDNVLVRKAAGIETAGSMNILFTDKTGTITSGSLTVQNLITGDGNVFKNIRQIEKSGFYNYFLPSVICNNDGSYIGDEIFGGNSTEKALLRFTGKRECTAEVIEKRSFDSKMKYSAVALNGMTLFKGAGEKLLPLCRSCFDLDGNITQFNNIQKIYEKIDDESSKGGRVIVMTAKKDSPSVDLSDGMIFLCAVIISDPIRRDAKKAVNTLREAGIRTVMITGDSTATARAIATECGIISQNDGNIVIDSSSLAKMSDSEVSEILPRLSVVSRALPEDKSRLVRLAQGLGLVAGMTGDGINDAPALKKADVGFAMGSGREIAKEASDIVILDDRLTSVCNAVLYGRTVFKSIRKFISFQLAMNLSAVGVSFTGQLLGIDAPVTVIQMLWVNIIMDTLGGLAFAGEAPLKSYMREKALDRDEKIVTKNMLARVIFTGVYVVTICTLFLSSESQRVFFGYYDQPIYFLTAFFALFIFSGIAVSFIFRSERFFLLANITKNKPFLFIMSAVLIIQLSLIYFGGSPFRCAPLDLRELARVGLISLVIFPADYIRKIFAKLIKNT